MSNQKATPTRSQLIGFRKLILTTVIVNGVAALLFVLTVLDIFVPLGRISALWFIGGLIVRLGSVVVAIVFLVKKSKFHLPYRGLSAIGLLPIFALGIFVLVAIVYVITLFLFQIFAWGSLIVESIETSLVDLFVLGLNIILYLVAAVVGFTLYEEIRHDTGGRRIKGS